MCGKQGGAALGRGGKERGPDDGQMESMEDRSEIYTCDEHGGTPHRWVKQEPCNKAWRQGPERSCAEHVELVRTRWNLKWRTEKST